MDDKEFQDILKRYRALMGQAPPEESEDLSGREGSDAASQGILWEEDGILEGGYLPPPLQEGLPASEEGASWGHLAQFLELSGQQLLPMQEQQPPAPEAVLPITPPAWSEQEIQFAREFYHRQMDLTERYDPNLGLYPGRARATTISTLPREPSLSSEDPSEKI